MALAGVITTMAIPSLITTPICVWSSAMMRRATPATEESNRNRPSRNAMGGFLYKENHALDAWFSRAYGDE